MTDNLAALFAAEPPDGTVLVAWRDDVPFLVVRDDNEAILLGAPDGHWWWCDQKSAKPMTLADALEDAERVEAVVPLQRAGLALADGEAGR